MQTTRPAAEVASELAEARFGGISPAHDVADGGKLETLVASMSEHGWMGAPLIVDGEQAFTGSHRLAAVVHLDVEEGIEVQVPRVQAAEVAAAYRIDWEALCDDAQDWTDRAAMLAEQLPVDAVEYFGLDLH